MKLRLQSKDCLSNSSYHRNGKCWWWVRIGPDNFAKIPSVRGDQRLDVEIEVPDDVTEVQIGVGKPGPGRKPHDVIRETILAQNARI